MVKTRKIIVLIGEKERECTIQYLKDEKNVVLKIGNRRIRADPRILVEAIVDVLMD